MYYCCSIGICYWFGSKPFIFLVANAWAIHFSPKVVFRVVMPEVPKHIKMLEYRKNGRWGDVFWQHCSYVKAPLLSGAQILLLWVSLSGSMSSCHCSVQKVRTDSHCSTLKYLPLQPVLPNISAPNVCKIMSSLRNDKSPPQSLLINCLFVFLRF